jgi:CYTH domain-containing protein
MSSQRIGKYACLELELKYLLRGLPRDLNVDAPHWQITDRYIDNTRLRLRHMKSSATHETALKFTQKYRDAGQTADQTIITNLYLLDDEYRQLSMLPGVQLQKRRYTYENLGLQYSIDVFEGPLAGLVLAEIECETTAELMRLTLPNFVSKDVTDDPFFAGSTLARLDREEFETGFRARTQE